MPPKPTQKLIQNSSFPYTVIFSRRKRGALVVKADGSLEVRVPLRTPLAQIEEIVQSKRDWILQQQEKMRQAKNATPVAQFKAGEKFWYLGKTYPLEIDPRAKSLLKFDERFILKASALPRARELLTRWYMEQARVVCTTRVLWLASAHGFSPEKVRISSARTRWGSCSSKKTLSFTWRLVMAPVEIIDYVIIHELVHLHHLNHSKMFWQEVEKILPDYKKRRSWLKKNGRLLTF